MATIIFLVGNLNTARAEPAGSPMMQAMISDIRFIFMDRSNISIKSVSRETIRFFASVRDSKKISNSFFDRF